MAYEYIDAEKSNAVFQTMKTPTICHSLRGQSSGEQSFLFSSLNLDYSPIAKLLTYPPLKDRLTQLCCC
jgi:hypothetical protein